MDKKTEKLLILNEKVYKKLAENNPERLQAKEDSNIHAVLSKIIDDKELHKSVKKYGDSIIFAESYSREYAFRGYSYLEIIPNKGLAIVMTELDDWADSGNERHLSEYTLYKRKGKVYFKTENKKEIDAAEAVTFRAGEMCNVDESKAQTAKKILKSLEDAIESIIPDN